MPQSLAQVYLHLVFSTKGQRPFLQDLCDELHLYLGGICRNLDSPSLIIGGVEDYVHLLCRFGRTLRVADLIRDLKRDWSKWIKTKDADVATFDWQSGYDAFSVSPSHVESLKTYIADQVEHHRSVTFQAEFRRLCQKSDVPLDERYVWD